MSSPLILDGRAVRDTRMAELALRVKALSKPLTLAIIQVGDRPDSTAFIKAKKAFAGKIGVEIKHIELAETVSQPDLTAIVEECNADPLISGIIVQLPLPLALDRDAIIETIEPCKDADACTSYYVKRWLEAREDALYPATARGIRELVAHYDISLFGARVTVVGRSMLVGKPIAAMCIAENATVNVCHSRTPDLPRETKDRDILIVAAGKPGLIDSAHVAKGQVVIDVGITRGSDGALQGDVDFESVKNKVKAISPVPGGVGPMTVCALFENLLDLCENGEK